mmetsp:Transcript_6285/g.11275  ORF Transcript_6285/g.11275 Transcript_6285/m.11275 type:complete len:84 (+) Transcript_6285:616-867(+)
MRAVLPLYYTAERTIMSGYQASPTIFLRPEEFAEDAESRLGRANGNTYQRKPGISNVHDGQIMIRLVRSMHYVMLFFSYCFIC